MSVTLNDFQPFNRWKPDLDGPKYDCCWEHMGIPYYLIDEATGRRYLNESKGVVRYKCFLLTLGTPIVHSIASIVNVAYRIAKLVTLSHFWVDKKFGEVDTFNERLKDAGRDLARIITQPFTLIGLELASLYGLFSPWNGRKLYASFERAQYGNFILAPCFQPDPESHLLGGNIFERDVL